MGARAASRRRAVDLLLEDLRAWAAGQPDVAGLALVGSYARGSARPGSDVDLVLLTRAVERWAGDPRWFPALRPGARLVRRASWGPVRERRYRLRSGLLVELGIVDPGWARVPLDPGTRRVLADGCRALHDPEGWLTRAVTAAGARARADGP